MTGLQMNARDCKKLWHKLKEKIKGNSFNSEF